MQLVPVCLSSVCKRGKETCSACSDLQQSGLAAVFEFQAGHSARWFVSEGGTHTAIGTQGDMMIMAILEAVWRDWVSQSPADRWRIKVRISSPTTCCFPQILICLSGNYLPIITSHHFPLCAPSADAPPIPSLPFSQSQLGSFPHLIPGFSFVFPICSFPLLHRSYLQQALKVITWLCPCIFRPAKGCSVGWGMLHAMSGYTKRSVRVTDHCVVSTH